MNSSIIYKPTSLDINLSELIDRCTDVRVPKCEALKQALSQMPIKLSDMGFNWLKPGPLEIDDVVQSLDPGLRIACTFFLKWLEANQSVFKSYMFGAITVLEGGIVNLMYIIHRENSFPSFMSPEYFAQQTFDFDAVRELYLDTSMISTPTDLDYIASVIRKCKGCKGVFMRECYIGDRTGKDGEELANALFRILDIDHLNLLNIAGNRIVSGAYRDTFFGKLELVHLSKLVFLENIDSVMWEVLFANNPNQDAVQYVKNTHQLYKS